MSEGQLEAPVGPRHVLLCRSTADHPHSPWELTPAPSACSSQCLQSGEQSMGWGLRKHRARGGEAKGVQGSLNAGLMRRVQIHLGRLFPQLKAKILDQV